MISVTLIRKSLLGAALAGALLAGATSAAPALATTPWWRLQSSARPTSLPPGGEGTLVTQAVNVGDGASSGAVSITDTLPVGVTAQSVQFLAWPRFGTIFDLTELGVCETSPSSVRCTYPEFLPALNPYELIEMKIAVKVAANAASGGENRVQVSGGEAAGASLARPLTIQGGAPAFGVEDLQFVPEEEGGAVDARAGSHPFQLSTTIALNQTADPAAPPALLKDLRLQLPAGLVGNATSLPQCRELDFGQLALGGINSCPMDTAVGVASVTIDEPGIGLIVRPVPVFNLVPSRGEPARFGFEVLRVPVLLDTSLRSGGDYGVTVGASNITQLGAVLSTQVTLWGVPDDPRHDQARGWRCLAGGYSTGYSESEPCVALDQGNPAPFLTLPTSCTAPFAASVEGDSWPTAAAPQGLRSAPREYSLTDGFGRSLALTGCDQLPFAPSLEVAPDTRAASTPTGLTVKVHVPQDASATAGGLAESALRDTTVALPEGLQVNPSSADGLQACSEAQVGYTGVEGETALFTPDAATCPDAAKVGVVEEVSTPLLANPLTGSVYLAAQNANPFGSLLALYLVAEDPVSGVRVKLAGDVAPDPVTGQLTATFTNAPQVPFEDLKLHFFGGPRASLSTPALCGSYTANASFTPWSGGAAVGSSASFPIDSGCARGFAPGFSAGSENPRAGGYSPFTLSLTRADGEQDLAGLTVSLPPGLLGKIAGIPLCADADASAGNCPEASRVGSVRVAVGIGPNPYFVSGGAYLTGPYKGGPYGLVVEVPAVAGPFDLGMVSVRQSLRIDPHTAQVTAVSDPFPTILDGIPLHLRKVELVLDRPGFTFNPTSCTPTQVAGAATSAEGASASVSSRFQVGGCGELPFKPSFKVSTQAHTGKKSGASLDVRVGSGAGQTNIGRVAVTLPKALPSRLSTIQQACPQATFNANPASCPAGSDIGTATAKTLVLSGPLVGPAYLVSHGGAGFPDLVVILQGEGVTLDLVGSIDIKKSVTSSTFASVPDAPISSFELSLPEGPHSALGAVVPAKAKGNLCGQSLTMPTTLTGQNGAQVKQSTKIAVTGCPKATRMAHGKKKAKATQRAHGKTRVKGKKKSK